MCVCVCVCARVHASHCPLQSLEIHSCELLSEFFRFLNRRKSSIYSSCRETIGSDRLKMLYEVCSCRNSLTHWLQEAVMQVVWASHHSSSSSYFVKTLTCGHEEVGIEPPTFALEPLKWCTDPTWEATGDSCRFHSWVCKLQHEKRTTVTQKPRRWWRVLDWFRGQKPLSALMFRQISFLNPTYSCCRFVYVCS